MADFDPTQFGAVAVEEPPPQEAFDPTAHGAIPVQGEERSIPSKIGHAVLDTLKGFIPQSVEDAALAPVTMFPGVGQAYKSLSNIVSGRPAAEGISPLAGIPVVQRIPEIIQAEKTPALSQERFTTAAGTLLDLSMIAGFKSALHPEVIAPKPLAEVAGIPKPETPMAAAVEPVPGVEAPTTETATQPGQFTTPVEATADQAARNLEGQFADLNTQAADLQARINAQRGTPLGKVEPVAPNLPTETGEVQPVTITGFHGTRTDVSNASQFGGVHIGSEIAANQRLENTPSQRVGGVPGAEKVQQVETTLRKPYGTPENPISETELSTIVNLPEKLQELKSRGYDGIIYRNIVEDAGNISALTFDPKQVIKVSDMRIGGTTGPMLVRKNAGIASPVSEAPVSATAPLPTETPLVEVPAGAYGTQKVSPQIAKFVNDFGYGRSHLNQFLIDAYKSAEKGDTAGVNKNIKFLRDDLRGMGIEDYQDHIQPIQDFFDYDFKKPTTAGEPNAVQEQSTSSVLQHPQEAVTETGGVGGGVEPVVKRTETPEARKGAKAQSAPQAEVVAPTQTETAPPTEPVNPVEPISEQPNTVPTPAESHALSGGEDPIGIAERYREEQQPGSVIPGVGRTADEARAWGHDFINKGGNPYDVVANKGPRRELWQDVGVVRAEYERLSNEKRVAESAMEANPNDAQARLAFENADLAQRKWSKDAQPVLTRAGDALRAASRSYPREINSFSDFTDIINDHFGGDVELTPEKRAELQKAVKAIKKGNVEATNARAKVTDAAVKKAGGKVLSFDDLKTSLTNKMTKLLENCPT